MTSSIFQALQQGPLTTNNRIVMSPLTRCRSTQPGNVPNALMAEYYAQRASAGLIVSEATQISPQGQGYSYTPGIHSAEQIEGWRLVTDAVHAKGGRMFLQLWHVGRMSHPSFHGGGLPVAPSAVSSQARVWVADENGVGGLVDCPTPRALTHSEIKDIVADYAQAAKNAMAAGFDGVEIHGANGYLIDQFLRTTSNIRTDEYGGSRDNRLRFLDEVVQAVVEAIGAERTAIRLAPFITARGMDCPDIIPTILDAAKKLNRYGLAYIHLSEADWEDAPQIPESFRHELRRTFQNAIMVAGKYTQEKASALLNTGLADLVAFGRPYISNPDLVARFKNNWALAPLDSTTLFGGNGKGYTDYPNHLEGAPK